jgi:hypothetical protein
LNSWCFADAEADVLGVSRKFGPATAREPDVHSAGAAS